MAAPSPGAAGERRSSSNTSEGSHGTPNGASFLPPLRVYIPLEKVDVSAPSWLDAATTGMQHTIVLLPGATGMPGYNKGNSM